MRCRGAIRIAVTFPNSGVIVGEGELCDAGVQYGLLSHSPTVAPLSVSHLPQLYYKFKLTIW